MSTVAWHELGAVAGVCTVCGADGALSMGEARSTPSLLERLRRDHVSPPARLVTCRDCGWRWPVRSTDRTAAGIAARFASPSPSPSVVGADEPTVAARTVLPRQREGHLFGRDRVPRG
jgi:hypothetical protein